ncbi:hypothetical protein GF362_00850 [Candidatus Dojkabacteria bacterium]|nr:hypothetical protein [Candidatus Dojkabacteria bacterium]
MSKDCAFTENKLIEQIKDIEILGIKSRTKITKKVLSHAKKLKVIGTFSVGTKHIDIDSCSKYKIPVFNDPQSSTRSVAELVIGNIIALSRGIFHKSNDVHNGIWEKNSKKSYEISNKILGIIGYGNIGSQVSLFAENLGMKVLFFDIEDKDPVGKATKCNSMKQLLKIADIITIHVDGREENTNLIDFAELELMKKGAVLINTSRGHVVNFPAVLDNLKSEKLHSGAFDVHPDEPNCYKGKYTSVLQKLPNVILTPHIGAYTEEAQYNVGNSVSNKIIRYISKNNPEDCVNESALRY